MKALLHAGLRPQSVGSNAAALPSANAAVTRSNVLDEVGDDGSGFDPRGDIVAAAMAYGTSSIGLGTGTARFDRPDTSVNWTAHGSGLVWGLDVNGDDVPDYEALMLNDGSGVIAGVEDANNNVLCGASASWDSSTSAYFVVFARTCIGTPARVRTQGFMLYSTATTNSEDITAWSDAIGPPSSKPVSTARPHAGYWMLGADGRVYPFGGAVGFSGSVPGAVAMAPRVDGKGYWIVDIAGHVFAHGDASFLGNAPALPAGEFVSTISATANGRGYWLFTNKGRALPFGTARSYGDMHDRVLNGPIVASVATPSGHGYYMVGSDGGIFTFGDAQFRGSTGNLHLNKPIVGIAPTPNGKGYWLVASDGGVFAFGAPFRGSMGGATLNEPVDGLVAFGNGYLMVASDGGIFDFSNKAFYGSLGGKVLSSPIIGLAAFSA